MLPNIVFHFRESCHGYYDDKEKATAVFYAGCLNTMISYVFGPNGTELLSDDEFEAMFQYFMKALKDANIRYACPPEKLAYMLARAYKNGDICEDDLMYVGKDAKKDDDVLEKICEYEKDAENTLTDKWRLH